MVDLRAAEAHAVGVERAITGGRDGAAPKRGASQGPRGGRRPLPHGDARPSPKALSPHPRSHPTTPSICTVRARLRGVPRMRKHLSPYRPSYLYVGPSLPGPKTHTPLSQGCCHSERSLARLCQLPPAQCLLSHHRRAREVDRALRKLAQEGHRGAQSGGPGHRRHPSPPRRLRAPGRAATACPHLRPSMTMPPVLGLILQ